MYDPSNLAKIVLNKTVPLSDFFSSDVLQEVCSQKYYLGLLLLSSKRQTHPNIAYVSLPYVHWVTYVVVGPKSFRPDIQKLRQMENAVGDI